MKKLSIIRNKKYFFQIMLAILVGLSSIASAKMTSTRALTHQDIQNYDASEVKHKLSELKSLYRKSKNPKKAEFLPVFHSLGVSSTELTSFIVKATCTSLLEAVIHSSAAERTFHQEALSRDLTLFVESVLRAGLEAGHEYSLREAKDIAIQNLLVATQQFGTPRPNQYFLQSVEMDFILSSHKSDDYIMNVVSGLLWLSKFRAVIEAKNASRENKKILNSSLTYIVIHDFSYETSEPFVDFTLFTPTGTKHVHASSAGKANKPDVDLKLLRDSGLLGAGFDMDSNDSLRGQAFIVVTIAEALLQKSKPLER